MASSKRTSRSAKTDHVLDDARNVLAAARKHQKVFAAADKGKRAVRVGPPLLNGLASKISALEKSRGDASVGRAAKQGATAIEVKARAPLYEALVAIRDDVATTHRDDKAIARAFGYGARIDRSSTPGLLNAANRVLALMASDASMAKAARDAGVNASRVGALKKAYDALAKAQAGQVSAMASARTDIGDRRAAFRKITADVAFIRKVASLVFRKEPKILATFTSVRPRAPSKRSKPTAPPAPPAEA